MTEQEQLQARKGDVPGETLRRRFMTVASLVIAGLGLLASALHGLEAAGAVLAGGLVSMLSHSWMVHGVAALLGRGGDPTRVRASALWGFVVRQGLLGVTLFALIVTIGLPAGWVLAGVTACPAALVAVASVSVHDAAAVAAVGSHAVRRS